MRRALWLMASLLGLILNTGAAQVTGRNPRPLPQETGQIRFTYQGEPIDVYTYKPRNYSAILVVLHGQGRNADGYRDYGIPQAERHGVLVVAPQFDAARFPGERYQRGGIMKRDQLQPREKWTYAYVHALVDEVRRREGRPDLPYYLIGHSAGGQFLIRLAAMMPGEAVRIVPANPGSLLFPTKDERWGYGFGGLPESLSNDDVMRAYLAAPVTLLLGTADTGRDDSDLDRSAPAMRQGPYRFARGHACFEAAKAYAEERGWAFNWRLIEVPGVGHSGRLMIGSPQASQALFGGDTPERTEPKNDEDGSL